MIEEAEEDIEILMDDSLMTSTAAGHGCSYLGSQLEHLINRDSRKRKRVSSSLCLLTGLHRRQILNLPLST